MIKVEGKGNISATVVADSVSPSGQRITTFELEYPRFIHAEFMTHRQFSRNAASSRAIPIDKVIEQVGNNPAMPIHWGKNQAGMQAKEEVDNIQLVEEGWRDAAISSLADASWLMEAGLHKQIVNRILEPYQFIKVVCTATEYENFFYLRDHADAQPEIAELARYMKEARNQSEPKKLRVGQWHLPYCDEFRKDDRNDNTLYRFGGKILNQEKAVKVSASLCAQVSYRKADQSIEKALKIYDQLVGMKPVHASPFEHQATPMSKPKQRYGHWGDEGTTHLDKDSNFWSGNFKGWIQNRQLISNHNKEG